MFNTLKKKQLLPPSFLLRTREKLGVADTLIIYWHDAYTR